VRLTRRRWQSFRAVLLLIGLALGRAWACSQSPEAKEKQKALERRGGASYLKDGKASTKQIIEFRTAIQVRPELCPRGTGPWFVPMPRKSLDPADALRELQRAPEALP